MTIHTHTTAHARVGGYPVFKVAIDTNIFLDSRLRGSERGERVVRAESIKL